MPTATQPCDRDLVVKLRFGYEVNLAEPNGLDHLFNAVFGETFRVGKELDLLDKIGMAGVWRECNIELAFISGQLLAKGSAMTLARLTEWFGVHWDSIMERCKKAKPSNTEDDHDEE